VCGSDVALCQITLTTFCLLQHLTITFDGPSGLMKTLVNTDKQISIDVAQSLFYYKSYPIVKKDWPTSDAYVFRSANTVVYPLSDSIKITVVQVCEDKLSCFYPRESFRGGTCNHRRWFVCLSVCLFVTTITE